MDDATARGRKPRPPTEGTTVETHLPRTVAAAAPEGPRVEAAPAVEDDRDVRACPGGASEA